VKRALPLQRRRANSRPNPTADLEGVTGGAFVLFDLTPARHAKPRRRRAATAVVATVTGTALALGLHVAGAGAASAHDRSFASMLAQLRACESGGNYGINTGNGYYGAYQFNAQTWRSVGGTGLPHQNPPHVQDEMATRLYERRGWQPWPSCSRKHGLHATAVTRPGSAAPAPAPATGSAPQGAYDAVRVEGNELVVSGWAFDRDTDGPIDVHVYVDGRGAANVRADQSRPDVQRAFGRGGSSGWSARVPAPSGAPETCVYAIGVGPGGNTLLGCKRVPGARPPIGHVDEVVSTPEGVRISGWTLDKDTPAQSTEAHVYVDGRWGTAVLADLPRPDVARALGVPEVRGFSTVVPHGSQVCGFAIETTGRAANTLLECRTPR
jgi:hypothetical protein